MDISTNTEIVVRPDINTEEVLAEFGLDGIENTSTVTQISDTSSYVVAPNVRATSELTPPSIDSTTYIEEIVEGTPEVSNNLLPELPERLMIDEATSRFSGASWYEEVQKKEIILAGLGGIGSWVSLILSRVKPSGIHIYDDDLVETANMSGQLFSRTQVGYAKVNAAAGNMREFSDYMSIYTHSTRWNSGYPGSNIMICGFDNMTARSNYFNSWDYYRKCSSKKKNCLFIDGRLNMNEFQVFCLTGDDEYNIERYQKEYLFDDSIAESEQCSIKQTSHCACMIASVMVNLFVNFVANSLDPVIPLDLPFKTYYNSNLVYLKTEL